MRFSGKTVIVTGAGRGIGLEVVKRFADEGAEVYGIDLGGDVDSVIREAGGRGGFKADVSEYTAIEEIVNAVTDQAGEIHALVNAAGIHRPVPFIETSLEDFQLLMKVNVQGTWIISQLVAKAMVASGTKGAIVNFSSIGAEHATPNSSAYSASKGAITSFTRGAAVSLSEHGIRVNAVAPGPVETPMNEEQRKNPEYVARMIERVPLGRQGIPEDVAKLVLFLSSDDSSWITGEIIRIDGGISVLR